MEGKTKLANNNSTNKNIKRARNQKKNLIKLIVIYLILYFSKYF